MPLRCSKVRNVIEHGAPGDLPLQRLPSARGRADGAWGLVAKDDLKVEGETKEYVSSEHGRRHFCPNCGTSLFYTSETIFPGQIDVQTATLDDPDEVPPDTQVQVAERLAWVTRLDSMPAFERYPGP